ncbi:MAG: GTPase domain-containing protein [Candidatus Thiothrix putei]|uniref:GTPase domain-containing protein n=1 Tax=Candidatus Thiothrix putei TaxID=3080811 RepID=A0AA95HF62_9GAMM|nr:MAG: GTPase domain-containing protein [Candidatus Thiothrix putei]
MSEIRALVFGSTGTGKTSLCNAVSGIDYPAESNARGVTFQSNTYPSFSYEEKEIIITDTIGLDESSSGTVLPHEAIQQIVKLLKASKHGYSLLIHVMKAPRITQSHVKNYDFFVDKLTGKKIPVILVVTGCENEDPMNSWVDKNGGEFIKDNMEYTQIHATCFAKGGRLESAYKELRDESKDLILKSILKNSLSTPYLLYENRGDAEKLIIKLWNSVCGFFGLDKHRAELGDGIYDILLRIGVGQNIAESLAKVDIFDIAKGIIMKKILTPA